MLGYSCDCCGGGVMADRMDPTVKAKWLAALRSGDYMQAKAALHDPYSKRYCCLGVLCDLYQQDVGGTWGDDGQFCAPDGEIGTGLPPAAVIQWAGSPDVVEEFTVGGEKGMVKLSSENDDGRSFAQIADLIEVHL